MKISYNWLKQYIQLNKSIEEIAQTLTDTGLEVEGLETFEEIKGGLAGMVIGEVLTCERHPNADKLSKTTVDVGNGTISPIVCGAPNVAAGQKVVVALVGTMLYPASGEPFKIKKAKIRGEVSEGMICAEDEIGLGQGHEGIMVLDTDLPAGTPAATYFKPQSDTIIEIGLTPNRADAASHYGVARDLKAFYKQELNKPNVADFKVQSADSQLVVDVQNTEAAPRFSGILIKNLEVKASPKWMQNFLNGIGVRPINNVVDITNYVLHSFGQPLHAYDWEKVAGKKIIVKTLPKGTKFTSLDEIERELLETDLMVCDGEENPMCIGGVFGGLHSGVTETTQEIFLEAAYFSPDYIRRSAIKHELSTDASYRFARGTDPNGTIYALQYAALLLQELAGGVVSSEMVDIYPAPIANFSVDVLYKNIDRLIGKQLDKETIHGILERLDIQTTSQNETGFTVSVPPYRVDVQREADVIEEILRIYGFNNVELSENLQTDYLANFPTIDAANIQSKISQMLVGSGCHEIFTNSLTSSTYTDDLDCIDSSKNVVMLNKLSEDLDVMRQTMVFSGLESIAHNINRKNSDLRFFEFGRTYRIGENTETDLNYQEKFHLGLYLTGNQVPTTWLQENKPASFYDLAGLVQLVLGRVNLTGLQSEKISDEIFQYGLSLGKKVGRDEQKEVVRLGLVSKKVAKKIGVSQEVFYAEFDWDFVLENMNLKTQYQELSKFPAVYRDLSLVVAKHVSFEQIHQLAQKTERKLLKEINVFDVYEGDRIDADQKAYAITFTLQDKQRTLTEKIIDKTMQRFKNAFKNELGAVIRGDE